MKKTTFRIVTLLFILSNIIGLLAMQPAYADNPVQNPPPSNNDNTPTTPATPTVTASTDPAVIKQAIGMIAQCKSAVIPVDPNSTCGKYHGCLNQPNSSDLCKTVKAYDGGVTPLTPAALAGCKKLKNKDADCYAAYAACLSFRVDSSSKVSGSDTKTCTDLVASGKLDDANKDPHTKKSDCVIQGIGWLICPVAIFLSKVVDAAYLFVSSLLTVQPLVTNTGDPKNTIYQAWSIMRNFANAAFVIAFLLIIFSQVTSIGITNYGIKRMLPRLVVAAILVNISFWVCAIAVDISNILGVSFNALFDSISAKLSTPDAKAFGATGTGWEGITVGVLAGLAAVGALIYVGLSALLPALIVALLAIVTVFLVLTLRQALIILLIVISPLAFVAYLLPNTEQWFKKWRELLQTLLLMYPIIAIVFGASALASKVVMDSATGPYKFAVQIMGALIGVMPLALTPIIMKSAGGLLNRFGGIINNPNRGPFDRMKKGAQGYHANRQEYRKLKALNGEKTLPFRGAYTRAGVRREAVLANRKSELNRANAEYVANTAEANDKFRAKLAGGGGDGADTRALANAISVKLDLSSKEVKAANAVIEHMNLSSEELNRLAQGGEVTKGGRDLSGMDDATRKAAIGSAVAQGTVGDVENLIKSAGSMTSEQQKVLASSIASSSIPGKATHLSGQTLDDIAQGNVTSEADLDRVTKRAVDAGKYSAEKLTENDAKSLDRVGRVVAAATPGDTHAQQVKDNAQEALTNDRLKGRVTDVQRESLSKF
jgi:hypothetical protein